VLRIPLTNISASDSRPASGQLRLLSVKEIAGACQLSEKAVRRAIDDGELVAVKLRSRLRVTPQDFDAWIGSRRQQTKRPSAPLPRLPLRRAPAGTFRALIQSGIERER
jgi:excisionase family DNA binding protein